jgi:hypothetical protein
MNRYSKWLGFSVAFIFTAIVFYPDSANSSQSLNCSDFTSHAMIQATFESDPERYANLDGDGDGVVCESLLIDCEALGVENAQATFEANPTRYAALDNEGDGVICEFLSANEVGNDSDGPTRSSIVEQDGSQTEIPWLSIAGLVAGVVVIGAAGGLFLR